MAQRADIVEFESGVKKYLRAVQAGEEIFISRGNEIVAILAPGPKALPLSSSVDAFSGVDIRDVQIHGNLLNEPCIPLEDWNMLKD
jgi:antitoxin (DNA-binding transcriptional repressor) of toxin-antitoxin stability system